MLQTHAESKHMRDVRKVSLLVSHEIKRTCEVYMWREAGPGITSISRLRSGSSTTANSATRKKASRTQRRNLCAMAPPKYTNKKSLLTHFLCLPLLTTTSTPQLQESLSRLKESVTRSERSEIPASEDAEANASTTNFTIPENAFRPLGVLHLTLGVMSLRSEEKMAAAKNFLESLDLSELLAESGRPLANSSPGKDMLNENNPPQSQPDPPSPDSGAQAPTVLETFKRTVTPPALSSSRTSTAPLVVSLQGLQAFPKPRNATVLHCPPHDPTSRLHPFCLRLKQRFVDAGFIEPENRPLVLHATIVNTVYAKRDRRNEKRRMGSVTFDATEIMRTYNENCGVEAGTAMGEFVWANDILIDRVRICEMGAKAVENTVLGQEYAVFAERII